MFPLKLPGNSSNSSSCNPFGFNYFSNSTSLELYPRRRRTEYYTEPRPLQEYQSQEYEHPKDKLNFKSQTDQNKNVRIFPPTNSDMRLFRDSYFS